MVSERDDARRHFHTKMKAAEAKADTCDVAGIVDDIWDARHLFSIFVQPQKIPKGARRKEVDEMRAEAEMFLSEIKDKLSRCGN